MGVNFVRYLEIRTRTFFGIRSRFLLNFKTITIAMLDIIHRPVFNVKHNVSEDSLCSSCQSSWLQTQRPRVRYPALPDFLRSSGSETGST
jgi:hypothetical protein